MVHLRGHGPVANAEVAIEAVRSELPVLIGMPGRGREAYCCNVNILTPTCNIFLADHLCVRTMHVGWKPASRLRAVISRAAVTSQTVRVVASEPDMTRRMAGYGTERHQLARAQLLAVPMLAFPIGFNKRAPAEKVEVVAKLAGLEAQKILLRIL